MSSLEDAAASFVSNSRSQWAELVRVARRTAPRNRMDTARAMAEAAGVGKTTLARKLEAIHAAMYSGMADDQIIEMGQAKVMSKFVKAKKDERTEPLVYIKFGVSPGLREALVANLWRIGKALKVKTQEGALEFVNALLTDLDEDQIRHLAGDGK